MGDHKVIMQAADLIARFSQYQHKPGDQFYNDAQNENQSTRMALIC